MCLELAAQFIWSLQTRPSYGHCITWLSKKEAAPQKNELNQTLNIGRKLDPTRASHPMNWPKNIPSPALSCRNHRSTSQPENLWQQHEPRVKEPICKQFFKEYRGHSQDPLHIRHIHSQWGRDSLESFFPTSGSSGLHLAFNLGRQKKCDQIHQTGWWATGIVDQFPNPSFPWDFQTVLKKCFRWFALIYKMWLADLGRVPFRSAPSSWWPKVEILHIHLSLAQLPTP